MSTSPAIHVAMIMEATAGGSRRQLKLLVPALRERGVTVDLILSARQADPDFDEDLKLYEGLGCRVFVVHMAKRPAWADLATYGDVKEILTDRRPDIVHTHCAKAGLLGRLAVRRAKLPARLVHTPHSYFFEGFRSPTAIRLGVWLERYLGGMTDAVFCVSEAEREVAERHRLVPPGRLVVGHNGLPDSFYGELRPRDEVRAELGLSTEIVALAFVARMVPKKGHLWLLGALERLPERLRATVRLCLFGEGPLAETIQQRIGGSPLSEIVRFYGYQPEAATLLAGMDAAVLPSAYEGLPYQLLEALAAGLPLIATDIPGNRLHYAGNPILYTEPGCVDELIDMIGLLADSPADRQALGERGRAYVRENYRLDRQVDLLLGCYRHLLGKQLPVERELGGERDRQD